MYLYQYLLTEHNLSKKMIHHLLKSNLIKVNGVVVTNGKKEIDGLFHNITIVERDYSIPVHCYYMLNKAQGYVTAVRDDKLPTVCDQFSEELWPIGRLDRNTEGLLILTDNGQLNFRLTMPQYIVEKTYRVKVNGELNQSMVDQFTRGIEFIGGILCAPAKLEVINAAGNESEALVTLTEGKFHQVKKMFLAVGLYVTYLQRIQYGPLKLDHDLQIGKFRTLTVEEVEMLWNCAQLEY